MTSCLERMVLNNNQVRKVGTMMMRDCDALDDPEEGTGCALASTARAPSAPEGLPWLLMLGAMCAIGVARRKRPRRV